MTLWDLRCHQWGPLHIAKLWESVTAPQVIHVTSRCWNWLPPQGGPGRVICSPVGLSWVSSRLQEHRKVTGEEVESPSADDSVENAVEPQLPFHSYRRCVRANLSLILHQPK